MDDTRLATQPCSKARSGPSIGSLLRSHGRLAHHILHLAGMPKPLLPPTQNKCRSFEPGLVQNCNTCYGSEVVLDNGESGMPEIAALSGMYATGNDATHHDRLLILKADSVLSSTHPIASLP